MSKIVSIENKIVKGCKLNKAKSQMQLYDRYCQAMFIIANRYVKNTHTAEDVMQDAFIKVFKRIDTYKGEVTIGAWIKKIVINQCIDYLKKRKIEVIGIEDKHFEVETSNSWSVDDTVNISMVIEAIESLPEKYKLVLKLYLLEGYDHQEIAQVLNITEVNSRSQLMRGKNKLKSQLKALNYA